jgi:hypothetical protein
MNWTNGYNHCRDLGGTLPVITTGCINDLVSNITADRAWTAGTRLEPYSSNSSTFQWVSNLMERVPFF